MCIRDSDVISRQEHLDIMENIFAHDKETALLELEKHLDRVDETIWAINETKIG